MYSLKARVFPFEYYYIMKSLNAISCPKRNQGKKICQYPQCKVRGIVCDEKDCICRTKHKGCLNYVDVGTLMQELSEAQQKSRQRLEPLRQAFDQIIKEICRVAADYEQLVIVGNSRSQPIERFLECVHSYNSDQITPQLLKEVTSAIGANQKRDNSQKDQVDEFIISQVTMFKKQLDKILRVFDKNYQEGRKRSYSVGSALKSRSGRAKDQYETPSKKLPQTLTDTFLRKVSYTCEKTTQSKLESKGQNLLSSALKLTSEIKEYKRKLAQLERRNEDLQKQRKSLQTIVAELKQKQLLFVEKLHKRDQIISSLEKQVTASGDEIRQQKTFEEDASKRVVAKNEDIKRLNARLQSVEKENKDYKSKVEDLQKQVQKLERVKTTYQRAFLPLVVLVIFAAGFCGLPDI